MAAFGLGWLCIDLPLGITSPTYGKLLVKVSCLSLVQGQKLKPWEASRICLPWNLKFGQCHQKPETNWSSFIIHNGVPR